MTEIRQGLVLADSVEKLGPVELTADEELILQIQSSPPPCDPP